LKGEGRDENNEVELPLSKLFNFINL